MRRAIVPLLATLLILTFGTAYAAVLTLPNVQLGVNADGTLDDVSANVGLNLVGVGDALIPGCPCESWGVNVGGTIGYAGPSTGTSNIVTDSFTNTATTAVSTTHLGSLPLLPAPAQLRELGMLGEDGLLLDHPPVLEDIGAGDVQVAVLDPLRERAVRDLLAGGVAHDGESPERALRPPQGDPPGGKRSAHQGRGKHC